MAWEAREAIGIPPYGTTLDCGETDQDFTTAIAAFLIDSRNPFLRRPQQNGLFDSPFVGGINR